MYVPVASAWPIPARLKVLLGLLLASLAAWWAVTVPAISYRLERIIMVSRTSSQLTLPAGGVVRQLFRTNGGRYDGVVVSSNSARLDGRQLIVRILDHDGRELAKSYGLQTYYLPSDNTLRLQFVLTSFTVAPHQEVVEEIRLLTGPPLAIRATDLHSHIYREGRLTMNGISRDNLIALALLQPVPLPFAAKVGVLSGLVFALGTALIYLYVPARWRWYAMAAWLALVTPLALAGFWFSDNALGIADWDYYFSLHHYYRQTILAYRQFPLWDPWTCGGTAALGDPEFPLLTVSWALEFLFGIPTGVRLAIFTSVAVGAAGMLGLAKRLGLSLPAATVTALAGAFGSVSLLEIVEGHVNVLAAMWIPWIFWAWYSAYAARSNGKDQRPKRGPLFAEKYTILCAVFLALTFYAGGIYLLMYTGLAFLLLMVLAADHRRAAAVCLGAGILALGLAAFKLVPTLAWLHQFPDQSYTSSTVTLQNWYDILLGRYLHNSYVIFDQDSGWHEYGAYVGPFVFALALLGLSGWRQRRVVAALGLGSLIAWLLSMTGPAIKPMFDLMWFFPRSNISRIILMAILPVAALAGFGLDRLKARLKLPVWAGLLLVGCVAVDLMSLSSQLAYQAFVLPHVYPLISPAPWPVAFSAERYDDGGVGNRQTRTYDAAVQGFGSTAYCSVLGPPGTPRLISDVGGATYAVAQDSRAKVKLLAWSPNVVRVRVITPVATKVGLNTNYAPGWFVNGRSAIEMDNRVAALAEAGDHEYIFDYRPYGLMAGAVISLLTVAALVYQGWCKVQSRT